MNEPTLYEHEPHWYKPRNANEVHAQEHNQSNLNQRIAVQMTNFFSSMTTFWAILAAVLIWIVLNALPIAFDPAPWPLLLALASVPQLPIMIIIMVGQSVLSRKQEIQSEEEYHTTLKIEHELSELTNHLHAQDERILKMAAQIEQLVQIQQQKPARVPAPRKKAEKAEGAA